MDHKIIKTANEQADSQSTSTNTKKILENSIAKVVKILDDNFPGYFVYGPGSFAITRGSTQVAIIVRHFLREETIIECISNVVTGAKVSTDLMYFLLRKNAQLHFGSFALLFDGTVTFSHTITGSNLDANELITSLSSVAFIADYYDDIIVDMAGGKRAADLSDDFKGDKDIIL